MEEHQHGDKEQQRRERAYKLWEDEGRPDGAHEDHWRRAEGPPISEQEAFDVTKANQDVSDKFARDDKKPRNPVEARPPSSAVLD